MLRRMTATVVMLAFLMTALAPTALADPGNGNGAGQEKETNGKSSDTQGKKDNDKQGAGKGKKDRAACDDGQDNDGDGKTDFPDDPGCTSKGDDDETDPTPPPPPPSAPQCSDGIDNDGDGFTDYPADLGCKSATQNAESCDGWWTFDRYIPGTGGAPWVDPLCFVDEATPPVPGEVPPVVGALVCADEVPDGACSQVCGTSYLATLCYPIAVPPAVPDVCHDGICV